MRKGSYKKFRENLKRHFHRRIDQHYGISINDGDRKNIISNINEGKASFIQKVSDTRSFYVVEFKGRELLLLYSKKHKALVTAYPQKAISQI